MFRRSKRVSDAEANIQNREEYGDPAANKPEAPKNPGWARRSARRLRAAGYERAAGALSTVGRHARDMSIYAAGIAVLFGLAGLEATLLENSGLRSVLDKLFDGDATDALSKVTAAASTLANTSAEAAIAAPIPESLAPTTHPITPGTEAPLVSEPPTPAAPTSTPAEAVPQIPTDQDPVPGTKEAAPAPAAAATPEQPSVDAVEQARRAQMIEAQSYETARLNITGIADPTIGIEPTQASVDAFKAALADKLDISPDQISDGAAREALKGGGYNDNGKSFEIFQGRADPTQFNFVDNPYQQYSTIDGVTAEPELVPPAELTPAEITELRNDVIQTGNKPVSFYMGTNPYDPGSALAAAWERTHDTVVKTAAGSDLTSNGTPIIDYLAARGILK